MAIDISTIKGVVTGALPAEAVKAVAEAAPPRAQKHEDEPLAVPKEQVSAESEKIPTTEEVVKAASEIKTHLRTLDTDLKFEVDIEDNEVVVKVLDPETNEVIRQVPSEEVMAIREKISRFNTQVGVLHDIKT